MTRVRVDLNISLDGYASTTDQTPENPFGEDWGRLTVAYVATRTFRERVLHDTSGAGTTGIDDAVRRRVLRGHRRRDHGRGDVRPARVPRRPGLAADGGATSRPSTTRSSSSRTARPCPSLPMAGGTTFHFRSTAIEDVLAEAT